MEKLLLIGSLSEVNSDCKYTVMAREIVSGCQHGLYSDDELNLQREIMYEEPQFGCEWLNQRGSQLSRIL